MPRQQLAGVADRRQRVAQLVREHREELVLLPVGRFERRRALHVRGDVAEVADDAVAPVGQRNAADLPLVVLGRAAIEPQLARSIRHEVRLARRERAAECA